MDLIIILLSSALVLFFLLILLIIISYMKPSKDNTPSYELDSDIYALKNQIEEPQNKKIKAQKKFSEDSYY